MKHPRLGQKVRPGRPLGFDRDAALYQAMLLFWTYGYEGSSVSDLTRAMGITPPSLYTAFGDKKMLFFEAVQLYLSGPITSESIIDAASSAREAAEGLLRAAALGYTQASTPAGCLLATSAISCSPAAEDVRMALATIRKGTEKRLLKKIVKDPSMRAMTAKTTPRALAAHVMTVIQGMSTMARDGATRQRLLDVAAVAMLAWPASD